MPLEPGEQLNELRAPVESKAPGVARMYQSLITGANQVEVEWHLAQPTAELGERAEQFAGVWKVFGTHYVEEVVDVYRSAFVVNLLSEE